MPLTDHVLLNPVNKLVAALIGAYRSAHARANDRIDTSINQNRGYGGDADGGPVIYLRIMSRLLLRSGRATKPRPGVYVHAISRESESRYRRRRDSAGANIRSLTSSITSMKRRV